MVIPGAAQPGEVKPPWRSKWPLLASGTIMLLLAVLATSPLHTLAPQEAEALWVIRDETVPAGGPGEILRGLRDNARRFAERVTEQPQPPLYFAALDAWALLAGRSLLALRWPSVLLGLLTLALLGRTAARMLPIRPVIATLFAWVLLLPAVSMIYTYALLGFFTALCFWALVNWATTRQVRFGVIYTLALAGALYSHHMAAPLVLTHAAVVLWRIDIWRGWVLALLAATLTFLPWLGLFQQRTLGFLLTGSSLLALWVVLWPPVALLLLGLQRFRLALPGAVLIFVLSVAALSASGWDTSWPITVRGLQSDRDPLDLLIHAVDERHPLAHYDSAWRVGLTLDIGWQAQTAETVAAAVDRAALDRGLWLILPQDGPLLAWAEQAARAAGRMEVRRWAAGDLVVVQLK